MERRDYLEAVSGFVAALSKVAAECGPAQLAVPVPACPGWSVSDLLGHLGSIERWVQDILAAGGTGRPPETVRWPTSETAAWFLSGTDDFLAALGGIVPGKPCWTLGPPPRTEEFWARRQAHEHAIHLWDAATALGLPEPVLDRNFLLDGIDEVLTILAPRQVRLGRMPAPGGSVVFSAARSPSDGGAASDRHTWKFGEGRAVARLNAPALELYLGLWGRRPLAAHATVHGDASAVDRLLAGHLVP